MSTALDTYLQRAYTASNKPQTVGVDKIREELKNAMQKDEILKHEVTTRFSELKALQVARGDKACQYSAVYRKFLNEVING